MSRTSAATTPNTRCPIRAVIPATAGSPKRTGTTRATRASPIAGIRIASRNGKACNEGATGATATSASNPATATSRWDRRISTTATAAGTTATTAVTTRTAAATTAPAARATASAAMTAGGPATTTAATTAGRSTATTPGLSAAITAP